jgi:hypothetical protein
MTYFSRQQSSSPSPWLGFKRTPDRGVNRSELRFDIEAVALGAAWLAGHDIDAILPDLDTRNRNAGIAQGLYRPRDIALPKSERSARHANALGYRSGRDCSPGSPVMQVFSRSAKGRPGRGAAGDPLSEEICR